MSPVALSIAGFDPTGGAGILQDARTMHEEGVWCVGALTAVTVQDTTGVHRVLPVEPGTVGEQIRRLAADITIASVKVGMLATTAILEAVADVLPGFENIVIDPIMQAGANAFALSEDVEAIRDRLVPAATLLTPNTQEAELLTGIEVRTIAGQRAAAAALRAMGAQAVLVKGGHLAAERSVDVLDDGGEPLELSAPRLQTRNVHGTGCVLSAAVAAHLATGKSVRDAVVAGKQAVTRSIENALVIGRGDASAQPAR